MSSVTPLLSTTEIAHLLPDWIWRIQFPPKNEKQSQCTLDFAGYVSTAPDGFSVFHACRSFPSEEAALTYMHAHATEESEQFLSELPEPARSAFPVLDESPKDPALNIGMESKLYLGPTDSFRAVLSSDASMRPSAAQSLVWLSLPRGVHPTPTTSSRGACSLSWGPFSTRSLWRGEPLSRT